LMSGHRPTQESELRTRFSWLLSFGMTN